MPYVSPNGVKPFEVMFAKVGIDIESTRYIYSDLYISLGYLVGLNMNQWYLLDIWCKLS